MLEQTERLFWEILTGRTPVSDKTDFVRGDDRLTPVDRLEIYSSMYVMRLLDSLAEDYPAVRAVLGSELFEETARAYIFENPPTHFSIRYAGRRLPEFIKDRDAGRTRPELYDLARLEWALMEVFDAADAPTIGPSDLGSVPPERWGGLIFQPIPALRILHAGWPVQELWKIRDHPDARGTKIDPGETHLLVWRQEVRTYHRSIDRSQAESLEAICRGETFGHICDRIAEGSPDDEATATASRWLRAWIEDGLLSAFSSS